MSITSNRAYNIKQLIEIFCKKPKRLLCTTLKYKLYVLPKLYGWILFLMKMALSSKNVKYTIVLRTYKIASVGIVFRLLLIFEKDKVWIWWFVWITRFSRNRYSFSVNKVVKYMVLPHKVQHIIMIYRPRLNLRIPNDSLAYAYTRVVLTTNLYHGWVLKRQ